MQLVEPHIEPLPIERFEALVGADELQRARDLAEHLRVRLNGRVVWHVNSTPTGGGVAEMLPSLLGYARGLGIDARWLVIEGEADFFVITKRLHHAIHGSAGDGSALDTPQRAVYEGVMRRNADALLQYMSAGDIAILHDPQTAGLIARLIDAGVSAVWRCHIGHDELNEEVTRAWAFLRPYVEPARACIFTRRAYAPDFCAADDVVVMQPSIDPFTPKNEEIDQATVRAILARVGVLAGPDAPVAFAGTGGVLRRVQRQAHIVREGAAPAPETPLVVQVSRWDPLKDPVGVMRGFAALVDGDAPAGAHLVLAGPDPAGVADDPEAAQVLKDLTVEWRALDDAARARVHLASLPTADVTENAVIVNALQRHATVVVQKSLHEGFGLTVTEAMFKARPLVASAVGGIQDQITDGEHGLLLADPTDLAAYGAAVRRLLEDSDFAGGLGAHAARRVRDQFLTLRHLRQYAELIDRLLTSR